ncbi:Swi3-domain-containing protein [Obba rivulosa]|uniref:Chromosome segregation in meiosis protein n=1 Tax=Obba rivulosa TaxID=1052685 RepID=A0A8E2DSF3_9APHY|nr:Swi3-domain-containing protein [Obba rivulosa]
MASVALEDIWDAPITQSPPRTSPSRQPDAESPTALARTSTRPRSTLFLDSDESEPESNKPPVTQASRRPAAERPDVDALFDDLDDDPEYAFQELAPALDLDALRREADAKNARARASDLLMRDTSSAGRQVDDPASKKEGNEDGEDGKKKRKPVPRLDEARLLGADGFPALVKQAKNFHPRGKGQELADLNSLLKVYQFWTQKMYPKTQFRDTVHRVEKLCHSKRMHVALSVWRDEAKGLVNGRKPGNTAIDLTSDSDHDSDEAMDTGNGKRNSTSRQGDNILSTPRMLSVPPSSASEAMSSDALNDFDIDAMVREDEERQAAQMFVAAPAFRPSRGNDVAMDEDEAMWDELMSGIDTETMFQHPPVITTTHVPSGTSNAVSAASREPDEDMWDLVREFEAEEARLPSTTSRQGPDRPDAESGVQESRSVQASNDEGWDEMYL